MHSAADELMAYQRRKWQEEADQKRKRDQMRDKSGYG